MGVDHDRRCCLAQITDILADATKVTCHGNAVLNWRGRALDEFGIYAESFHEAANVLAQRLCDPGLYSDADACPIVFLYRHALELSLKGTILAGARLIQLIGAPPLDTDRVLSSHRLAPLLPPIKQVFEAAGWDWDTDEEGFRSFEDFRRFIRYVESLDPASHTFRYPVDKQRRPSVDHHFVINVPRVDHAGGQRRDSRESGWRRGGGGRGLGGHESVIG